MNFDSWIQFSDEKVQRRLVDAAQRSGLPYAVDDECRFWFCHAETHKQGNEHPSVLALNEVFGPEWIALQMDSSDDLQRCVTDLAHRNIRHLIETTETCRYVIVDRTLCPSAWSDRQV